MARELTPREVAIIEGVIAGWSVEETGERLGISKDTVRTHRENVLRKMDCHSMPVAVGRYLTRKHQYETLTLENYIKHLEERLNVLDRGNSGEAPESRRRDYIVRRNVSEDIQVEVGPLRRSLRHLFRRP